MTTPNDPSQTPPTTSAPLRPALEPHLSPDTPQGTRETTSAQAPPPLRGAEVSEPSRAELSDLGPEPGRSASQWTPEHPSTKAAWHAVLTNLTERWNRGLWSSRTIAASIAQQAGGLTYSRAEDLIRSAIRHGYLDERPYPGNPHGHHREQTQVRPAQPLEPRP